MRGRRSFKLVYVELHRDRGSAVRREGQIKGLKRAEKERLIKFSG